MDVQAMTHAARQFVDSLTVPQKDRACYEFPDDLERSRFYYTPTDHGGIPLTECSSHQQQLALQLVASGLSIEGYAAATAIMATEFVLEPLEGWPTGRNGERVRDPLRYFLSIFGVPEESDSWGWRFGGHHLSLNYTIVNGQIASVTPSFFGADPASHVLPGGGLLRPLGLFEDLGRQLVLSLDEHQRRVAVLSPAAPVDIVTHNWPRLMEYEKEPPEAAVVRGGEIFAELGTSIEERVRTAEEAVGMTDESRAAVRWTNAPKGIRDADLNPPQREILDALVAVYLERIPGSSLLKPSTDDLHFAWAGGTEPGHPHYYRLQADRLLIEYDNCLREARHVHTVWRDQQSDFGRDLLAEHYAAEHRPES